MIFSSSFKRFRLFQKITVAIFLFFMGLMLFVFFVAMRRSSGSTGLDMSKVQLMRSKALKNQENP